jgi:hypothetical protein
MFPNDFGSTKTNSSSYVDLLLIAILRPFSQFTKLDFGPFQPRDRCYSHCTSLMNTIWTFRALTNLHSEYWYMPMLATVAFVSFREAEGIPALRETLVKSCKCLGEMATIYPLASDALSAIRGAFRRAGMPVPVYLQPFLVPGVRHREDGLLHHAIARLMPGRDPKSEDTKELRYQDLLNELENVEMDGT